MKKLLEKIWQPFIVIAYSGTVIYLHLSRKILFFIHSDYQLWSIIGSSLLLITGTIKLIQILSTKQKEPFIHSKNSLKIFIICLLPLISLFILDPKPLSSSSYLLRTSNNQTNINNKNSKVSLFSFNPEARSFADWYYLFHQTSNLKTFEGMKAKITGFVVKSENLPENTYLLTRFTISCCSADATPISIPIEINSPIKLKNNDWIEVNGTLAVISDPENKEVESQTIGVKVTNYQLIQIPENPYVY